MRYGRTRHHHLKFWDNKKDADFGSNPSSVHEFLRPYCNIYITEVKPYPNREGEYNASDKTLLVFEPDYLLEAKELSECCQTQGDNPLVHLPDTFGPVPAFKTADCLYSFSSL